MPKIEIEVDDDLAERIKDLPEEVLCDIIRLGLIQKVMYDSSALAYGVPKIELFKDER